MIIDKNKSNEFVTNPGNRYHILYKATVLKSGDIRLTENGKEDIWQIINSEKESCDMQHILKQMSLGDYSMIRTDAQYLDLSTMPTSKREVLDLFINIESRFNELDLDTRNKFDNDWRKWYMETEDMDSWSKKMSIEQKEIVIEKEQEVKENVDDAEKH